MNVKLKDSYSYLILSFGIISTLVIFVGYKLVNEESLAQTIQVDDAFNFLIIFGVLFGIIKFASKVSLACSFSRMNQLETYTVATVYFSLPLIISFIIELLGSALGSVLTTVTAFDGIIGVPQAAISILLLFAGIYTIKKWSTSKKNVVRKTSLFMVFPCPGTIITMFTTAALLIIGGIDSLLTGLIIGFIFVFFIFAGGFIIKKTNIKRDPQSFGSVMLLFGVLYIFSVLFVPAYIPVSQMEMTVQSTPLVDLVPGIMLMSIAILIGYLMKVYTIKKTMR